MNDAICIACGRCVACELDYKCNPCGGSFRQYKRGVALPGPEDRPPGVISSHWIEPSPLSRRPLSAITSAPIEGLK